MERIASAHESPPKSLHASGFIRDRYAPPSLVFIAAQRESTRSALSSINLRAP
jgi:hypothetical protein